MTLEIPKTVSHALEADEIVKWVGKPSRMPKIMIWFFRFFYGFFGLFALITFIQVGVPLLKGETPIIEGEPVTFARAWPPTFIFISALGGFWFLFRWNFGKYRYVVTDRRAFHYRPIWGVSWSWSPRNGFERDYDDPEMSPISGGYFTSETRVSRNGSDEYGTIEIGPLRSTMDDVKTISTLKSVVPALDNIIYDPSNLDFVEVKNYVMAEMEINSILRKYQNEQAHRPI